MLIKYKKILIAIILIIVLLTLFIYSSFEYNKYDPDLNYILDNFEKYNNTEVNIGGKITDINLSQQIIFIKTGESPYKEFEIDIENVNFNGEIGDNIEILGTLNSPTQITAKKILVSPSWEYNLVYIRSLPAIPFALYLFFRSWKFNKKTFRFERRKEDA